MKHIFSTISILVSTVMISGSMLYGSTNAVPVSKHQDRTECDPMPDLSTQSLEPDQIPNQYVVNLRKVDDFNLLNDLPAYIESQKHCSGADLENVISMKYISESGGGAFLSGTFDKRILAWISKMIGDKGNVEPNVRIPLAAIRTTRFSPWGLSRINYPPALPNDSEKKFNEINTKWPYHLEDTQLGEGARIYIIDSGVRASHSGFWDKNGKSRVEKGWSYYKLKNHLATEDPTGHGTAVASLAAGLFNGVAKLATIVPYKIMEKMEAVDSDIMQMAIHTAVDDFVKTKAKVGVINISFDLKTYWGLMAAIKHAIKMGMHVTIAAGNKKKNACRFWDIWDQRDWILVGTVGLRDTIGEKSNFGDCVDMYAPGEDVFIAGARNNLEYTVDSGTSFSAAYTAGVVAIIGASDPELAKDPKKMKEKIVELSAKGKITNLPDQSRNRILQSPVQGQIILDGDSSSEDHKGKSVKTFLEWLFKAPRKI